MRTFALMIAAVHLAQLCPAQENSNKPTLPTVWVLSTGGTISAKGESSTSLTYYKAGA